MVLFSPPTSPVPRTSHSHSNATSSNPQALKLEVDSLEKQSLAHHTKMEAFSIDKVAADVAQEGGVFSAFPFSLW